MKTYFWADKQVEKQQTGKRIKEQLKDRRMLVSKCQMYFFVTFLLPAGLQNQWQLRLYRVSSLSIITANLLRSGGFFSVQLLTFLFI